MNLSGLLLTSVMAKHLQVGSRLFESLMRFFGGRPGEIYGLQVPIIRLQSLIRFLDLGQTLTDPSPEDGVTFNQIRSFLGQCITCNRFCPEGPGRFDPERNVSFYVTSDGDGDGRVVNQKETMLRVSPSKTQVWAYLGGGARLICLSRWWS